jgi:hypothetical protein
VTGRPSVEDQVLLQRGEDRRQSANSDLCGEDRIGCFLILTLGPQNGLQVSTGELHLRSFSETRGRGCQLTHLSTSVNHLAVADFEEFPLHLAESGRVLDTKSQVRGRDISSFGGEAVIAESGLLDNFGLDGTGAEQAVPRLLEQGDGLFALLGNRGLLRLGSLYLHRSCVRLLLPGRSPFRGPEGQ